MYKFIAGKILRPNLDQILPITDSQGLPSFLGEEFLFFIN